MNWLSSNWIWLALSVGALALFASGRGCGMGHGGHNHRQHDEADQREPPREVSEGSLSTPAARVASVDSPLQPSDHEHGAPAMGDTAFATERAGHGASVGQSAPRQHRHGC